MFEQFLHGYLECALWAECLEGKTFAVEAAWKLYDDARNFWGMYHDYIEVNASQAGHNFWLSRNGHGAGYFDGHWPEKTETILMEGCNKFGGCDLYVGDDGLVYAA